MSSEDEILNRAVFPHTRWTLIVDLQSGDEKLAGLAMEELCSLYWYPVYAFVRRRGAGVEDAQDLAQGFFAQLIERGGFKGADAEKGKLRMYLLGALKNYLVQDWRVRSRLKRGGGMVVVSIDEGEARYALEPAEVNSPDELFDRRWAMELLEEAMKRLEREYDQLGKRLLYSALHPYLLASPEGRACEEIGPRFGMSRGAVQVAVHRLRQRFRGCLESVVGETVATPEEVPEELRYLVELLVG